MFKNQLVTDAAAKLKSFGIRVQPDGTTKVTNYLMGMGMSRNGSWSNRQIMLLGVPFPLESGWRRKILGSFISARNAAEFLALKDAHLKKIRHSSSARA